MEQLTKVIKAVENFRGNSTLHLVPSLHFVHVLFRYFAAEIIGNQLDVEPRRWRRPRKINFGFNKERVATFRAKFDKFDWTGMIDSNV